jgi:hypothetical protein
MAAAHSATVAALWQQRSGCGSGGSSAAARQRLAAVWRWGNWVVGGKGIKSLGYCEVIKPAIIFCDCKKAIKCILRVHYNDKRFHFVTAKKQLSVFCECTEQIFCCVPNTGVGSLTLTTASRQKMTR